MRFSNNSCNVDHAMLPKAIIIALYDFGRLGREGYMNDVDKDHCKIRVFKYERLNTREREERQGTINSPLRSVIHG